MSHPEIISQKIWNYEQAPPFRGRLAALSGASLAKKVVKKL